jgi:hypothetical protein
MIIIENWVMAHFLFDFSSSRFPKERQFDACIKAPKTGVNKMLSAIAILGFQMGSA